MIVFPTEDVDSQFKKLDAHSFKIVAGHSSITMSFNTALDFIREHGASLCGDATVNI